MEQPNTVQENNTYFYYMLKIKKKNIAKLKCRLRTVI